MGEYLCQRSRSGANSSYSNTVLYNAGVAVDPSYFGIADYINVLEASEAAYRSKSISSLTNNGKNAKQSTMIIYSYKSGSTRLLSDVQRILGEGKGGAGVAGLGLSDLDVYDLFSTQYRSNTPLLGKLFNDFVSDVSLVGKGNNVGSASQGSKGSFWRRHVGLNGH